MASKISSLLIGMQFDGSQAEEGMAAVAASADSMAESVKNASGVIESATADVFGKGLQTAKDFAASIIASSAAMATLALSSEGIQTKLGIVFDSAERGMAVFDELKDISVKSSIGLDELSDSAMKLADAGFSASRSLDLVEKASKLDILAGGGGRGLNQVTNALAELQGRGFATVGIFEKLKSVGVDAADNLADELGKATGKKFTPDTAMDLLERGGVLGGTGKAAVEAALADPKALAAAEKLGNTVVGKIDRIKNVMTEAARTSGEALVDALPIKEFVSMVEGAAIGVRDVIEDIADQLDPFFDKSNENSIQAAFEFGKAAAKDIAFTLLDAGAGIMDSFGGIQKLMMTIEGNAGWWNPMTAVSGLWDKEGVARRNAILDKRDSMGDMGDSLRERLRQLRLADGRGADFGPQGANNVAKMLEENRKSLGVAEKETAAKLLTDMDKFGTGIKDLFGIIDQAKKLGANDPIGLKLIQNAENLIDKSIEDFRKGFATGGEKVVLTLAQVAEDSQKVRGMLLEGAREERIIDALKRQRESAMAEYEESTLNSVQAFIRGQDSLAKEMEAFRQIADPAAQGRMTAAALAKTQGALEAFEAGTLTPFEKYFAERGKIEKELDSARSIADAAVRERVLEVLKRRDEATQEILAASVQTDWEKIQKQMETASNAFDQGVINADENAVDVAARQMGQIGLQIANMGRIGDSFFAQRADRGSVEEYQARMRDRFGDTGRSVEDLIEAGNRQAKAQSDTQIELLHRIANKVPAIMPGKVVLGRN